MPNNIYNVKQAAKILGLSTNTTYKYLNEGRIKAARGHLRGTFIITAKSLENFLGSKLPEDKIAEVRGINKETSPQSPQAETVIEVSPPTLAIKVTRVLITLALLSIIAELVINKDFSPASQIGRIIFVALVFLITYQFGGFVKK